MTKGVIEGGPMLDPGLRNGRINVICNIPFSTDNLSSSVTFISNLSKGLL